MIPRPSLFGVFTRQGRFRNGWAKAFAEPDPVRCLDRLRALWPRFGDQPGAYAEMWPAFLASVLGGRTGPVVSPADLTALEDIGLRLAGHGLRLGDALRPLLTARDLRRQPQAACALLTRMYHVPDVPAAEKADIARALATRGARGDDQLAIYVAHLEWSGSVRSESVMLALLTEYLSVGFDADRVRIKRAGELAGRLRTAALPVANVDLAMGFASLLIDHGYPRAAHHFELARAADRSSLAALLGLLAAWARHGDHDLVVAVTRGATWPLPPVVARLGELCVMLMWLDDPRAPGPPPCDLNRLVDLDVRILAGDWLDFAVGRAHLLAGNAGQAAAILVPLAERHPECPQWNYHAAWALALRGDREGVRRHFLAARDWSGGWTVGCLLLDTDPDAVDLLAGHPTPDEYTDVIDTRLALARRRRPAPLSWPPGDCPLPEALESLRTMLGQRLTGSAASPIDHTVRAMLDHLPLADQLLWTGIAALATDRGRGRAALEQAAHRLGYPRAALVLAVHHLEDGRHGEAEHLLGRFGWRTDPDFQVVRAWARAHTDDGARAELERLAAAGSSRAHYALGSVYSGLMMASSADRRRVFAEQAAAEFRAALADPDHPVPADAAALARCAELVGTGDPADADGAGWAAISTLPAARRTPWMRWLLAIAELTGGATTSQGDAAEYLVDQVADTESVDVRRAVAQILGRACLVAPDPQRAGTLAQLIGRLALLLPDPEIGRLRDLANAASARLGGPVEPDNTSLTMRLVEAERSMARDDRPAAAAELRLVRTVDEPVGRISVVLADLLDGGAPTPDEAMDVPSGLPRRTNLAMHVVKAATLADHEPDRSIAALVPVIGEVELTDVVDLHRGLPLVCARIGRLRQSTGMLADLILGMATTHDAAGGDDEDLVMLARCAAAIGDQNLAARLWRDAFAGQPEPVGETRAEYVRFLCHQAVLARRRGDAMEAAYQLLLAARVGSGRALGPRAFKGDEITALHDVFETVEKELQGAARKEATAEWRTTVRCVAAARQAGDERRAVLLFAQLEDLVDLVGRGAA
jgi:hypothetical protein